MLIGGWQIASFEVMNRDYLLWKLLALSGLDVGLLSR